MQSIVRSRSRSRQTNHSGVFLTLYIGAALLISLISHSVLAQTEFDILSTDADIETQYREELDKWMLRAYEGDRDAQFKVGVLFTNDQFDKPDYEQAVYWYKQAARQGHVLAQYNLGHQYLTGVGVIKNNKTAMQWWLEAAKQDHALAQFNIGRAYYLGIGLNEDHEKSKYWFERAAQNQEPKSIEILKQLGWYDDEAIASRSPAVDTSSSNPGTEAEPSSISESDPGIVAQSEQAEPEPAERPENGALMEELSDDDRPEETLASRITPLEEDQSQAVVVSSTDSPGDNAAIESDQPAAAPEDNAPVDNDIVAVPLTDDAGVTEEIPELTPEPAQLKPRKTPVALYTNPKVRSVLIAIVDDRDTLSINDEGTDWSTVESSTGFPVWMHGDFLRVRGEQGTVTGQAVNARSVPIVTNGTVVGKLNKGETVTILDKRKEWYRIVSPVRFKAWVKTEDFHRYDDPMVLASTDDSKWSNAQQRNSANQESTVTTDLTVSIDSPQAAENTVAAEPASSSSVGSISSTIRNGNRPINDNEWLFSQPADSYTLQLASFDDPQKIAEFVSRNKFVNNPDLHRFTAKGKGKDIEWTYFLYGSYEEKQMAENSKLEINQKLAWIRTFGRLQQNRCVAWKTQLPTPKELNKYCTQ
ncbi:MAG: SH3 domain-containing protein [Pseudomonadota bacterium]